MGQLAQIACIGAQQYLVEDQSVCCLTLYSLRSNTGGMNEKFSILIRKARERARLSQIEVADRACVTQGFISKLESGRLTNPRLKQAFRVCDVLDLNPNDIYR